MQSTNEAKDRQDVVMNLKATQVYRDYEESFTNQTKLPLTFRPVGCDDMPHEGRANENPFCALMRKHDDWRVLCLTIQRELETSAAFEAKTMESPAGLAESAVPVRIGDHLIGFLKTGQFMLHPPSAKKFVATTRSLQSLGEGTDLTQLKEVYYATRVITDQQCSTILKLLGAFAKHLGCLGNEMVLSHETIETLAIT